MSIITIILLILLFIFLFKLLIKENFANTHDNNEIPKIIIQTWKTDEVPDKYINDILSLKKYNNDFEFKFFTDKDIEQFLEKHYPEYYEIYKKLPIKIQKIDYFRYVAVYHYGGFYFDLDMTGFKSLSDLCKNSCIFPIDSHIDYYMCEKNRYKNYCRSNMKFLLGQYAFAAKPKHPFIKKIIDEINNNIDVYIKDSKTEYGKTHDYVYKSTGPDFVTNVYMSYNDKNDITILNHEKNQYFGDYAKHNYYGTWK